MNSTIESPTTVGAENTQPPGSNSHRISGPREAAGPVPWVDKSRGAALRLVENTLRPKRGQVGSSPVAGEMIAVTIHALNSCHDPVGMDIHALSVLATKDLATETAWGRYDSYSPPNFHPAPHGSGTW